MLALLLKSERPGYTADDAKRHVEPSFGPFEDAGHGNRRMLAAIGNGIVPIDVKSTKSRKNESYLLVEYP